MWKLLFIAALVGLSCADDAGIEEEEGVLVLTEGNFDGAIKANKFVLVEFYAPWCGHCKSLAPEYAQAAQALAAENSDVKLAKVDATEQKSLGTKFGVKGYPTLKFFIEGEPMDYGGGRTKDTIVTWLKKKTGPPAKPLNSVEDAEKFLKEEVAVIGFFKDVNGDLAKKFLSVAMKNDEIMFGISSEESVWEKYEVTEESVVLFKDFDEKRADLKEELTEVNIKKFVAEKSVALLTIFSQPAAQKIFSDKERPFFFLIMSMKSDDYESVSNAVRAVAEEFRGKFLAVVLNTDDESGTQVMNYLGVKKEEAPTYRIINLVKNLKYKPEDDSAEKIKEFVESFLSGDLKPFLKSADIPDDWDKENVKVLVGKNFKEVALDDSKHVFVEFYAPWCGHCKKLTPIWEELADKYANNDDVIIAKMDSTENEVEEVSIQGFPTIKFFPANSKGKIVDFNGGRDIEGFMKFLKDYAEPVETANDNKSSEEVDEAEEAKEEEEKDKKEEKKDKKEEKKDKKEEKKDKKEEKKEKKEKKDKEKKDKKEKDKKKIEL